MSTQRKSETSLYQIACKAKITECPQIHTPGNLGKLRKFRKLKLRGKAAVLLEGLNRVSTVASFLEALLSNDNAA